MPLLSSATDRTRGIFTAGAITIIARGFSLVASIIVIPTVGGSLSPGEFGLWLNLTTVFGMLAALDFGVGPAVLGQLSAARGHDDVVGMRRVVSTAFALLTAAAILLLAVFGLLLLAVRDWNSIFGVARDVPQDLVRQLLFALVATTALSLPLTIASRVYYSLQRGHFVAFNTMFGVALQTAGLFGVAMAAPDLNLFFATYLVTSITASVTTTFLLLTRSAPQLRPRLDHVDRRTAARLGREGIQIFLLGILGILSFRTDALVIGHYLGMHRVPDYVLPFNIFAVIPALVAVFLTPLWAAYREARARGDHEWVRAAYIRSMALTTAVSVLAGGALVAVAPSLLSLWVGNDVAPPSPGMLAALASYAVVMCASTVVSVFLHGQGVIGLQLGLGSVMAVLNVSISIWSVTRIGLDGPLWSTVFTQTFVVLIPSLLYTRQHLAKQRVRGRVAVRDVVGVEN